jgi:putative SOS response-associated peptidase YedK
VNKLRARSRVAARNAPAAFRDEQAPARQANFTLAGIWAEWRDPNGIVVRTCSIVTCAANEQMKPYHDRMPVILDRRRSRRGSTRRRACRLMAPYAGRLAVERATLRASPAGSLPSTSRMRMRRSG